MDQALAVLAGGEQNMVSFVLATAEGEIIGIESAARSYEVLPPREDLLVLGNHYLSDRFKPMDIFAPLAPDTYLRYNRLRSLAEGERGSLAPSGLMALFSDHNNHPKSICMHPDRESVYPPARTLAAIVMVPEEKRVFIAHGNLCETDFVAYTM